jgi:hypothetical protein
MSTRSARRRRDAGVPHWSHAARCWCRARATELVRVGALTGPVCARHTDPDGWPPSLLVELVRYASLGGLQRPPEAHHRPQLLS